LQDLIVLLSFILHTSATGSTAISHIHSCTSQQQQHAVLMNAVVHVLLNCTAAHAAAMQQA
jgi:hypothetical protein